MFLSRLVSFILLSALSLFADETGTTAGGTTTSGTTSGGTTFSGFGGSASSADVSSYLSSYFSDISQSITILFLSILLVLILIYGYKKSNQVLNSKTAKTRTVRRKK